MAVFFAGSMAVPIGFGAVVVKGGSPVTPEIYGELVWAIPALVWVGLLGGQAPEEMERCDTGVGIDGYRDPMGGTAQGWGHQRSTGVRCVDAVEGEQGIAEGAERHAQATGRVLAGGRPPGSSGGQVMHTLWKLLFPTRKDLAEARAENRAARVALAEKLKHAQDEGVTVFMSREALTKLRVREDGSH